MGRCALVVSLFVALAGAALSAGTPQTTVALSQVQIPAIAPEQRGSGFSEDGICRAAKALSMGQHRQYMPMAHLSVKCRQAATSSAISAGAVQLYSGADWPAHPSGGECPTGGGDAELPSGPVGSQLAVRLSRGGFSFAPNTFAVLTASPQVAQAYLPTLSYLGQR